MRPKWQPADRHRPYACDSSGNQLTDIDHMHATQVATSRPTSTACMRLKWQPADRHRPYAYDSSGNQLTDIDHMHATQVATCQYFCWRNCHTLLHQDSSVIEIAIPLSPHLEIVTRRSSAHQKHYAQRQCPSLLTAGWLIPRGHTRVSQASAHQCLPASCSGGCPQLQFALDSNCSKPLRVLVMVVDSGVVLLSTLSGLKHRTQLGGHS